MHGISLWQLYLILVNYIDPVIKNAANESYSRWNAAEGELHTCSKTIHGILGQIV